MPARPLADRAVRLQERPNRHLTSRRTMNFEAKRFGNGGNWPLLHEIADCPMGSRQSQQRDNAGRSHLYHKCIRSRINVK